MNLVVVALLVSVLISQLLSGQARTIQDLYKCDSDGIKAIAEQLSNIQKRIIVKPNNKVYLRYIMPHFTSITLPRQALANSIQRENPLNEGQELELSPSLPVDQVDNNDNSNAAEAWFIRNSPELENIDVTDENTYTDSSSVTNNNDLDRCHNGEKRLSHAGKPVSDNRAPVTKWHRRLRRFLSGFIPIQRSHMRRLYGRDMLRLQSSLQQLMQELADKPLAIGEDLAISTEPYTTRKQLIHHNRDRKIQNLLAFVNSKKEFTRPIFGSEFLG